MSHPNRIVFWAALASGLLLLALAVPGDALPEFTVEQQFAGHSLLFGAWTYLSIRAYPALLGPLAVLGLAVAVGSELAQAWWMPLRSGSVPDALANGLGVAFGLLTTRVWATDLPSPSGRAR